MRTINPIDMETLVYKYGFDYHIESNPSSGAVATLNLNCIYADGANLEFHKDHVVLETAVAYGTTNLPHCQQIDYMLKIKMPIWVAKHIAQETTHRQKEES